MDVFGHFLLARDVGGDEQGVGGSGQILDRGLEFRLLAAAPVTTATLPSSRIRSAISDVSPVVPVDPDFSARRDRTFSNAATISCGAGAG
jgi:hypothetical protein